MKDIKGYEGLYAVTSCGKVWSYKRQKFLNPRLNNAGYLLITLCKDGKPKTFLLHRLICAAYRENPNNYKEVNHKNEVKTDNYINNLEFCDRLYNARYSCNKPVYCAELNKTFDSIKQASQKLDISKDDIGRNCRGKLKTAGGYHWRYA